MNGCHRERMWRGGLVVCWLLCGGLAADVAVMPEGPELQQNQGGKADPSAGREDRRQESLPRPNRLPVDEKEKERSRKLSEEIEAGLPPLPDSILPKESNAVDLPCVLKLANVDNPNILIARQRVAEAQALRLFAMAQLLPNLNAGMSYDAHTGPLQQSSGNILQVNRNAFYLGMGAAAVAAGTASIPGIMYNLNVSEGMFRFLAIRYNLQARRFDSLAVRNRMLLRVATGYLNLVLAEGRRAVALQNQKEAREIARLTAAQARTGVGGTYADANRAAAELAQRNALVVEAEREVLVASARLAALLNIPTAVQLHAVDGWVVPATIVPDATPLHDLLYVALNQRPELAARRADIREALALLTNEKVLPFSPTVIAGYSTGTFGGGSNLVAQPGGFQGFAQTRFGQFAGREDVDVIMFWTAQNFGAGNWARIRLRGAEAGLRKLEFVRELNMVRSEVATAYAGVHARYAQIDIARRGVEYGYNGYRQDFIRIFGREQNARAIELLDNFRLTAEARYHYLDAVVGYNKAQFALYVSLGQPPASVLAHPIPSEMKGGPNLLPAAAPPLPACAAAGGNCAPTPEMNFLPPATQASAPASGDGERAPAAPPGTGG